MSKPETLELFCFLHELPRKCQGADSEGWAEVWGREGWGAMTSLALMPSWNQGFLGRCYRVFVQHAVPVFALSGGSGGPRSCGHLCLCLLVLPGAVFVMGSVCAGLCVCCPLHSLSPANHPMAAPPSPSLCDFPWMPPFDVVAPLQILSVSKYKKMAEWRRKLEELGMPQGWLFLAPKIAVLSCCTKS